MLTKPISVALSALRGQKEILEQQAPKDHPDHHGEVVHLPIQ